MSRPTADLVLDRVCYRPGPLLLDEVTVTFPAGRVTAVAGPSGSGKTTLLSIAGGLVPPTSGTATYDGAPTWAGNGDPRPEIAFVLQVYGLVPILSARENVAIALRARGVAWDEANDRAETALARFDIADLGDRQVEELSGGQRQRVWVAMVLAQQTPYLLLDEPTTFLDITHQYQLLSLLARLRDEGRTVVAVLHDINQACRFADHLVAMKAGRIVAEGAPRDIVDADLMAEVFDLPSVVIPDPVTGTPMVVPIT